MTDTFPEDSGTFDSDDNSDASFGDAARFAALAHVGGDGLVVSGFDATADWTANEITIAAGQARVVAEDIATRTRDGAATTWPEAAFVVQHDGAAVSISESGTTEIWLAVDLAAGPDAATIEPSEPSVGVLLAVADADSETVDASVSRSVAESLNAAPEGHGDDTHDDTVPSQSDVDGLEASKADNPLTATLDADANDITNVGSVDTEQADITDILTTVSSDAELDAVSGGKILLAAGEFTTDRTFNGPVHIEGVSGNTEQTTITGEWTATGTHTVIKHVQFDGSGFNLILDGDRMRIIGVHMYAATLQVNGDRNTLSHIGGNGEVVFAEGTSENEIGVISDRIDVTDNGDNSIL